MLPVLWIQLARCSQLEGILSTFQNSTMVSFCLEPRSIWSLIWSLRSLTFSQGIRGRESVSDSSPSSSGLGNEGQHTKTLIYEKKCCFDLHCVVYFICTWNFRARVATRQQRVENRVLRQRISSTELIEWRILGNGQVKQNQGKTQGKEIYGKLTFQQKLQRIFW